MNEVATKPAQEARKGLGAPMPSKHSFKPLAQCTTLAEAFQTAEFRERIEASVPQHVQPGRMLRTFVTAVGRTPLLAQASLRSFIGACLTLSQVGLEPNTPLGHAYLIPFKTRKKRGRDWEETVEISVIFGYPGLLDLSYRTGQVKAVHADVVWPGDDWICEYGTDAKLMHRPKGLARTPETMPTHAYAHAMLKDGQAYVAMPYNEVLRIRDKSQAYRAALASRANAIEKGWSIPASYTEAPWVAHEVAMAKKTAFRNLSNWLPRSIELASAIAIDEAQDRRRPMDFGSVMDAPSVDGREDYLGAAVDAITDESESEEQDTRREEPEKPTTRRAAAPRGAPPPPPPQTATVPPKEEEIAPGFEAMVIDHTGDALRDEAFTDPAECVTAMLAYYRGLVPDEAASFLEFNADLIEELRPNFAGRLAALDEPPADRGGPPTRAPTETSIVGVSVPNGRGGKPDWPAYLKAAREALAFTPPPALPGWLEMQRDTLIACPIAQRMLAVKAISQRFAETGSDAPAWLAEIIRPMAGPAQNIAPVETGPSGATGTSGATSEDRDLRWAEDQIRDVATLRTMDPPQEALTQFKAQASGTAIRTRMARLRTENPDLFNRVADAFTEVQNAIEARIRAEADDQPGEEENL